MSSLLLLAAFAAGLALTAYGAYLAWRPTGWLVGGIELVTVSLAYTRGRWASSTR